MSVEGAAIHRLDHHLGVLRIEEPKSTRIFPPVDGLGILDGTIPRVGPAEGDLEAIFQDTEGRGVGSATVSGLLFGKGRVGESRTRRCLWQISRIEAIFVLREDREDPDRG